MGMNDPDWGRVGVVPPDHHLSALGDATRWGATVRQQLPGSPNIATFPGGVLSTDQILDVSCRDGYSRAWTIVGTISAPEALWALPDGVLPGQFASALAVTAGVGQASVVHVFNIRQIVNADAPFYYPSEFAGISNAGAIPPQNTRPYAIPGAIVGAKVQVRLINSYFFSLLDPGPFPPTDFVSTLAITPFSAGVEKPK